MPVGHRGWVIFVVIEGIDACGKGTQVELLAEHMSRSFPNVTTFKYPDRATPIGKLIDQWLKGTMGLGTQIGEGTIGFVPAQSKDHALTNQALLLANKVEVQGRLLEAFQRGHVVADRYTPSGIAYGVADGLDFNYLYDHHHMPLFQPDLYVLLDMPVDESFKRRPNRQEVYEKSLDRLYTARATYTRLAALPEEQDRWLVLDGTLDPKKIHFQIADAVELLYSMAV